MSKTWFVTGTDTDVGKTAICCALIEAANARGLRTAAVKPVAAGCDAAGRNQDALLLQAAISEPLAYEQINPIALEPAIAPHIAAQREGKHLHAGRLAGFCRGVMMSGAEFILIEGAGGWRVPINPRETLAHLAVELQVEVILVVAMRLGCINHALLTAQAIAADGLKLAAWVANSPHGQMSCYEENLATLQSLLPAPLLGEVPPMALYDPHVAKESLSLRALIDK